MLLVPGIVLSGILCMRGERGVTFYVAYMGSKILLFLINTRGRGGLPENLDRPEK